MRSGVRRRSTLFGARPNKWKAFDENVEASLHDRVRGQDGGGVFCFASMGRGPAIDRRAAEPWRAAFRFRQAPCSFVLFGRNWKHVLCARAASRSAAGAAEALPKYER